MCCWIEGQEVPDENVDLDKDEHGLVWEGEPYRINLKQAVKFLTVMLDREEVLSREMIAEHRKLIALLASQQETLWSKESQSQSYDISALLPHAHTTHHVEGMMHETSHCSATGGSKKDRSV